MTTTHTRCPDAPSRRRFIGLTLLTVALTAAVAATSITPRAHADDAASARVLLITGNDHPAHDWKAVSAALKEVLIAGGMDVDLTTDPEELATRDLARYDVIFLNYLNWAKPGLSDAAKSSFVRYLANGGGLVVHHASCGAFNGSLPMAKESDWPEYRKIVRRVWIFGETKPVSFHDPYGPARVEITSVDHPITRGLSAFDTTDEVYFKLEGDEPIEPLAVAHSKLTGNDEPMAFAHSYGKGRVFQITLGHAVDSVHAAGPLTQRGTLWSAGKLR